MDDRRITHSRPIGHAAGITTSLHPHPQIAVDSGAADDFGSVDPTSNTLDDARGGMTLISATGDLRTSVATDDFDVPLPSEGRNHHAFRQGDVQQPPLSVGKACDEGCDEVSFKRTHCSFLKDDIELF